ncbi:hypothetical protein SDC9_195299 [bioreactor metagenome]|uniref:Uncharacterized protein n=1 Tax=bioreactor metagenome TaxID=1076179 RepID=A0A645I8M5_9ZZZZ
MVRVQIFPGQGAHQQQAGNTDRQENHDLHPQRTCQGRDDQGGGGTRRKPDGNQAHGGCFQDAEQNQRGQPEYIHRVSPFRRSVGLQNGVRVNFCG